MPKYLKSLTLRTLRPSRYTMDGTAARLELINAFIYAAQYILGTGLAATALKCGASAAGCGACGGHHL